MEWTLKFLRLWLAFALALYLTGCKASNSSSESLDGGSANSGASQSLASAAGFASKQEAEEKHSADDLQKDKMRDPKNSSQEDGPAVCDPLGTNEHVDSDHGLKGTLYYQSPNSSHLHSVLDYLLYGTKVDATLFFSSINVPTRSFDKGFAAEDGTLLKTPAGETLFEWFAISLDTVIKAPDSQHAGNYQFAILSDDGSIVSVDRGHGMETLIDNDGFHPTRMGCATKTVYMDEKNGVPVHIDYFQGPRTQISLVLMWRLAPAAGDALWDSQCGLTGNEAFFDWTTTPPTPNNNYQALMNNGWHPVPAEAFNLPPASAGNPCPTAPPSNPNPPNVDPTPVPDPTTTPSTTPAPVPDPMPTPQPNPDPTPDPAPTEDPGTTSIPPGVVLPKLTLVGFDATTATDSAFVIWQTPNVSSMSQVRYGVDPANLDHTTLVEPGMVTVHQMNINGLPTQTRYYLQAVSTDIYGRTVVSEIISKETK